MRAEARPNDHRRIALRLSEHIAAEQIFSFIVLDIFLLILIMLNNASPSAIEESVFFGEKFAAFVRNIQGVRYLDIGVFWALVSVVIVQIVLLLVQTARLRKGIRELLEPLRELRVAADAISGRLVDPGALRSMTEALRQVEANDMNAHIAPEVVSPELRPLLEVIEEMLARLEAAYTAQTKFVSDASHELRTPIAVVQGYANLLSRWGSEDPDTLMESIEAIRSEADGMKKMVNQLLFLARGDSETLHMDMQRVDIVSTCAEVLREEMMIEEYKYEDAMEEEGGARHEIEAQFPDEGVFVSGDPALIKQLVRILADNSINYTPAGGNIRISVASDPEKKRAFIMVQDEGRGIPQDVLPHIFDRFVRADEARVRNTGGSGLGLSIAKQIAERHGGSIGVFSLEGIGSRFTVILPLSP